MADKPYRKELFLLKALILRIFKRRETLVQFISQYIRITYAQAFGHGVYIYSEWFLVELGHKTDCYELIVTVSPSRGTFSFT